MTTSVTAWRSRFARRSRAQSLDLEILTIDLGCALGRNLDLGEEKRMRREPGEKSVLTICSFGARFPVC